LCADQLLKKEVDIGLIPSIECQRIDGLRIIPGVSISSLAEVRSILLIRPKGNKTIRTVALDSSSRTSATLVKILLLKRMGLNPEFVSHPPDLEAMLKRCDAALLIGDAALRVALDDYETLDLASEWVKWQRKPFVCALWACRSDCSIPENLSATFQEAKLWGLDHRSEIAAEFSAALNLPISFLESYLENNINFDLSADHIKGAEAFYKFAAEMKLIPGQKPLQFV
jgi:predicted solute-binding protein